MDEGTSTRAREALIHPNQERIADVDTTGRAGGKS